MMRQRDLSLFSILAVSFLNTAWADDSVARLGGGLPLLLDGSEEFLDQTIFKANQYQLGSEWGKKAVTSDMLQSSSAVFRRAVMATASTGGGTAFYLGKFAGYHVMATNHHVYPSSRNCKSGVSNFPLLGKKFTCSNLFGSWTDVDLALYAIRVMNVEDETALAEVAANFSFNAELKPGQMLMTAGFGIAENQGRKLVVNQDSDCKVFSKQGDYRFMADPDEINTGSYKVWSFANGCDVSHGDSGSAIVDRNTGAVVGLLWTGRIPKSKQVQESSYLDTIVGNDDPAIWSELTYSVPAPKIGEFLRAQLDQGKFDATTRDVVEALLK